ncbi:MAG: thiamine phosphate synthase [Nitrospirota bacterium]|nr:thiamine phosphate synthase [Nitrospirota bacterium]MDH5585770.1 thiamine phosphate synthase [Nitrospirota bacterium]
MTSLGASRCRFFSQLAGLYLILDQRWASHCSLLDVMREAGEVGVKLVQYRNKLGSMQQAYEVARALRDIAAAFDIVFVVNDRCDLAMAVGADGVHLGQTDLPLTLARNLVGQEMLIGVSTHNPHHVQQATEGGADYLGFGPIFPTGTKSDHDPVVGIQGMKHIRNLTALPIFAIGGIRPDSVSELRRAGANGVAVASGILDATDRSKAMVDYLSHFE